MKILIISPKGNKTDVYSENGTVHDLDKVSKLVTKGITQAFDDITVSTLDDIVHDENLMNGALVDGFDLYLCDLTTSNPNITYLAGRVEGNNKPIIYYMSADSGILQTHLNKRILQYSAASIETEFRDELNTLIELAKKDLKNFTQKGSSQLPVKPKAFVSYSHSDKSYLDRLMVHLKPLDRKGLLDVWADTKLKTGDQWKAGIEKALNESNIAILLISADFMASDFIVNNELPPLLSQAEVKGTKILPVILSPCRFSREPSLSRFQAANSPSEPLSSMNSDRRESIYDQLANDIEKSLE